MDFEEDYAVAYAALAFYDERFLILLLKRITSGLVDDPHWIIRPAYPTFAGRCASPFMHTALTTRHLPRVTNTCTAALRWWQEESWGLSQVGPHLGLNHDYDVFVLKLAPLVLAASACLSRTHQALTDYIMSQAYVIFSKLLSDKCDPRILLPTAAWLLHASAALHYSDIYAEVAEYFRRARGVNGQWLACPLLLENVELLSSWILTEQSNPTRADVFGESPLIQPPVQAEHMISLMREHLCQAAVELSVEQVALIILMQDHWLHDADLQQGMITALLWGLYMDS